jgi:hypothetical protein
MSACLSRAAAGSVLGLLGYELRRRETGAVLRESRRVCAWCERDMGPTTTSTGHDSRGICQGCLDGQRETLASHNQQPFKT